MYDWIIGGTTYSLDDGTNYYMDGISGHGMMPVTRFSERGPLQDGVTDRGYRLDPRTIMLSLYIKGSTYEDLYDKRAGLINIFRPSNTAGTLKFTLGSTVRSIKGHYIGDSLGLEDNSETYLTKHAMVVLKCPDPRWYDPTINVLTINLGGGVDTYEVPMEIPFTVGVSVIDSDRSITYTGSIKSYPTIRITGPIANPVVTNTSTGYKLDFTGTTIAAGDWYEIDLGYSDNTIVNAAGTNVLDKLTTDSDLVDFAIEPAPVVTGGVNAFNFTGSSITAATKVDITYYTMYLGI